MKKHLYHGSITPGIKELQPRKRFTPSALGKNISPAIYATDDPCYAVAHGFPWNTKEGFDTYYRKNKLILNVPKKFRKRLKQKIYIYKLPRKNFKLLKNVKPIGRNYRSHIKIKPTSVKYFKDIIAAFKYYKRKIRFI